MSVFTVLLLFILFCNANLNALERKINFDQDWKFYRGSLANAEQANFNDSKWRVLDLPHDWSVEPTPVRKEGITIGPFSRLNESGAGGADLGQTLGGEGWYRKVFIVSESDKDRLFTLYFEGVYNQSELFINGTKVYFNPYGYISYQVDITKYCNAPGIPNTIAVRVVNAGENSRWYSGSGIYRHVWLLKTDRLHLNEWDTFIRLSELKEDRATVFATTILHNTNLKAVDTDLQVKILTPEGKALSVAIQKIKLLASGDREATFSVLVDHPELWSLENPVLYRAQFSLSTQGKLLDEIIVSFGIRTIAFDAREGFLLNGRSVKLKGGCLHHDNGLLGAVAIDRAEARKVELMKANGYNAVRCAHNPPSEYFLRACDELGLLVIDESFDQWQKSKRWNDYHQYFDQWSDSDMSSIVRRDRNHPSVIMWSIGNEIADRADSVGIEIAKRLRNTVRKYDTTRYITAGVNEFWDNRQLKWDDSEKAFRHLDVAGYNYMWKEYENDHGKHPERVMYGSESVPKEAAVNWNLVEKHPYVIGDFVWTVIDYLGEAGLAHSLELSPGEKNPQFMEWPWYNAWCGDIDFCGDKKPQSYYRDVLWRKRKISVAVQAPVAEGKREDVNYWGWRNELLSWNWKGLEGKTMKINVYSRSPRVRLYLNNEPMGEKDINKDNYSAIFEIPYKQGELKAVNVENQMETDSVILKTAGEPAFICLTVDRSRIKANKNDLAYVKMEITDKDGNLVPDANVKLTIKCEGNGHVIASGNAAPDDMKSFRSLNPDTFRGRAIAILQPDEEKEGMIRLIVSAQDLPDSVVDVRVEN